MLKYYMHIDSHFKLERFYSTYEIIVKNIYSSPLSQSWNIGRKFSCGPWVFIRCLVYLSVIGGNMRQILLSKMLKML